MEVILTKDIENLGYKDDLKAVKPGYARNYLIPQGFAIPATAGNKKMLEETIRQRSVKEQKLVAGYQVVETELTKESIKVGAKVSEKGKIFGSINTTQIADAIKAVGHDVNRKQITIKDDNIKEVGTYTANIRLHKDVEFEISFEIVAE
jgi:large subunit ribosomal protein L9